jgi:energy-coupling factor transporter ATP-binding protein EcfA2
MKVTRLKATNVHGYLPIDVELFSDLTFLIGLNGSGKTSALRLLMALLTPNIAELASITFSEAEVTVADDGQNIVVKASRSPEGIKLQTTAVDGVLEVDTSELELFLEVKRREELRSPIQERWLSSPVYQSIRKMSTPMFLGLDRRFFAPGVISEDMDDARRREYMVRRYWPEDPAGRGTAAPASLIEVNYLVVTRVQEIRASQEQLDEKLRAQFFTKAFEYKPSDVLGKGARLPSRVELDRYREQLTKIEEAAEGVKIPVPAIRDALTHFFERMSKVVDSLEKSAKEKETKKDLKRPTKKARPEPFPDRDYVEWIINKPQADKILEHLRLLDEYIEDRNSLRNPIHRFLSLVNGFLSQTKKLAEVASNGQLTVLLDGSIEPRPITALSSGERQLLVMLAHLSLNPSLKGSGVFIVDEPELSLHIDWQEKFVDAIREANPNVQLILATHSPAIILDRVDSCRSMS